MTDIKIEKTQGGYKATEGSEVYYSGDGWNWSGRDGYQVSHDEPICSAFIAQIIDPPAEPKPEPIKVGDLVECVTPFVGDDRLKKGWIGVVRKVMKNPKGSDLLCFDEPVGGVWDVSRFIHAPKPKTYTGDPSKWKPGVYGYTKRDKQGIAIVGDDGSWTWLYNFDKSPSVLGVGDISSVISGKYHRIADTLSEILRPDIADMEAK